MLHARLPQMERLFLTDAGLESDMIFNHGIDLPCFSSLMLLRSAEGRSALEELGSEYRELLDRLPQLTVLGGCCGTDIRHVRAIAENCVSAAAQAEVN